MHNVSSILTPQLEFWFLFHKIQHIFFHALPLLTATGAKGQPKINFNRSRTNFFQSCFHIMYKYVGNLLSLNFAAD